MKLLLKGQKEELCLPLKDQKEELCLPLKRSEGRVCLLLKGSKGKSMLPLETFEDLCDASAKGQYKSSESLLILFRFREPSLLLKVASEPVQALQLESEDPRLAGFRFCCGVYGSLYNLIDKIIFHINQKKNLDRKLPSMGQENFYI